MPQAEDVILLHRADIQVSGVDEPLTFRMVLNGSYRLTRIPTGAVKRIQLLGSDREVVWTLPVSETVQGESAELALDVSGGTWGKSVDVHLPQWPFTVDRLRLTTGEVLPIEHFSGRASVLLSPGLSRAKIAYVQGLVGASVRSMRVRLNHLGADCGSAIEMDGRWQSIDDSEPLDATTMRTHRLLAKVKWATVKIKT